MYLERATAMKTSCLKENLFKVALFGMYAYMAVVMFLHVVGIDL